MTRYTSSLGLGRVGHTWLGKDTLPHLGGLLPIAPARDALLLEGASDQSPGAASQRLERFLRLWLWVQVAVVTCPLDPASCSFRDKGVGLARKKGSGFEGEEKFWGQTKGGWQGAGAGGRGRREGRSWGRGPTCSQSPRAPN